MPGFQFKGDLTVAYQVSDRKRAIAWYRDVLGFDLLYDVEQMGWCEVGTHLPGVSLGFSEVESPSVEGGPTLTWGVTDLEEARAEMEGKGVRFDGDTIVIPEMVKLATFYDPDGNHLMLVQSLAREERDPQDL